MLLHIYFVNLRAFLPQGGDVWNYLVLARYLGRLHYPLRQARLPLYPLLILLGWPFFDPVIWAKTIGILAAIGTLILVYKLGRTLRIPRKALHLAMIFLSVSPIAVENATRVLSDSLFTFMVLASLCSLYRVVDTNSSKAQLLFGTSLGLACMTRYEGYPFALVSFASLAYLSGFKRLRNALIPFLVIISPWLVRNSVLTGNPFHAISWKLETEPVATDLSSLWRNMMRTRDIMFLSGPYFREGLLWERLSKLGGLLQRFGVERAIGFVRSAWWSFWVISNWGLSKVFLYLGFAYFAWATRRRGFPVALFVFEHLLSGAAVGLAFDHYHPLEPIFSIFLGFGIYKTGVATTFFSQLSHLRKIRETFSKVIQRSDKVITISLQPETMILPLKMIIQVSCHVLLVFSVVSILFFNFHYTYHRMVATHYEYAPVDLYEACKYLAGKTKGGVAFARPYGAAVLLSGRGFFHCFSKGHVDEEGQFEYILGNNTTYVVRLSTEGEPYKFTVLDHERYRDYFRLVKEFVYLYGPLDVCEAKTEIFEFVGDDRYLTRTSGN